MAIDSTTVWTVFGVVATVSLGGWSLFYAIAARRYPGRISFVQEDCIGLFDSIVRNFPEIVISYQNNLVGKNLVLLKGAFLNTGTKDITKEMVASQLTIVLPKAYNWLNARVVAASPEVASSITHSNDRTKLTFDLGLFRCGEYVRFDALAEVPASEPSSKEDAARRLKEGLAFDHRIADTRRVDSREISLTGYRRARIRTLIVMLAVNAVLAGIGLGIGAWLEDPTQEGELQFWLVANDSKSVLVTVQPLADGNLRLKGVNEKFNATMPVEAFFLRHKWKPIIAKRYGGIVVTVMMAVILVLSATMAGYFWMTIRREARLKYILALSSPKEQEQASA